mgnify:CR=1 FL=1
MKGYKTKIAYSKMAKKWVLYDFDGFAIGGYSSPSKARKAKLYWWLYLTLDNDRMKYLDKLAELGEGDK